MTAVDWISLLQTFGLAVVILFAIGVALWRTAKWLAKEIIIPLRDKVISRLTEFLAKIEGTVAKVDLNVDTVTNNLKEQTASLALIIASTEKTTVAVREKNAAIEDGNSTGKTERAQILAEVAKVHALTVLIMAKLDKILLLKGASDV